jgi:hypothetical protein
MNHHRAKPGLPSRFRTTTVQANKQTVEAETGWLSQRFAPSEKPKPSPRGHRSTLAFIPRCGEPAVGHSFENARRYVLEK